MESLEYLHYVEKLLYQRYMSIKFEMDNVDRRSENDRQSMYNLKRNSTKENLEQELELCLETIRFFNNK